MSPKAKPDSLRDSSRWVPLSWAPQDQSSRVAGIGQAGLEVPGAAAQLHAVVLEVAAEQFEVHGSGGGGEADGRVQVVVRAVNSLNRAYMPVSPTPPVALCRRPPWLWPPAAGGGAPGGWCMFMSMSMNWGMSMRFSQSVGAYMRSSMCMCMLMSLGTKLHGCDCRRPARPGWRH